MNRTPRPTGAVEYRAENQDRLARDVTDQSTDSVNDEGNSQVPEGPEETEDSTGFVQEFTVDNFQETVLRASKSMPVLVEFYADT